MTTNQVASFAGVTLRQLQWWDEKHVVQPVQHGKTRTYTREEAVDVAVIAELRRRGISLQAVRKILRQMQKEIDRYFTPEMTHVDELWLIVDPTPGRAANPIKIAVDAYQVVSALTSTARALHVINLRGILQRLVSLQTPRQLPAPQQFAIARYA